MTSLFPSFFRPLTLAACVAVATSLAFAAADFPLGTYVTGEYSIVFGEKGRFRVSRGAEVMVEGGYKVTGNEIRLTDEGGPMACKEAGQGTGTYGWKYEGEALTLSEVEDTCGGRSAAMTAGAWKLKKPE